MNTTFYHNQVDFAFLSLTYGDRLWSVDLQRWRSRHSIRRSEHLTRSRVVTKAMQNRAQAKAEAYRRR